MLARLVCQKSAAGGGSQWREAFILTIDGRRRLRCCHCQFASHRTILVAAAKITLSAASVPVVLTCSPIAAIMKTQFQTQDTMQTPQALLDSVSAFHFKRERLFSERRRCEAMSTFSGRKNSGMEIPDYAIERIARCLLPMIQAYYESDEGQAELAVWNEKKDAEDTREHDRQTA